MDEADRWRTDEDVELDFVPGSLCHRIWQERVFLKLSQRVVAEKIHLHLARYKNIEIGRGRPPDLVIIASLGISVGMDVNYILIGKRNQPMLRPDEVSLLDNYRNSTSDSQTTIQKVGSALAKQDEELMQQHAVG